jgi:uncharacterized protein
MDDQPRASAPRPCPICGKPAIVRFRPFCSDRCRLVDLGRWLNGRYSIPTEDGPEDESSDGSGQ